MKTAGLLEICRRLLSLAFLSVSFFVASALLSPATKAQASSDVPISDNAG